jgi:hypothetical protein
MPMSQDLPFDSGDLRLRWPPQLFLAVAKGLVPGGVIDRSSLDRLLDEAFVDSRGLSVDPLRFLVSPPTDPELTSWISGVTAAASQLLFNRYLTQLVNAVGDGSIRSYSPRRYYRERLNPVQAATPIVDQDVGAALCAVLVDLDNHGYFDDAFGPSCCDERADRAGAARSLFEQLLGPETPWQWMPSSDGQDLDHVYDLVEVCHDVVSRPRTRTYHGYCQEWDYDRFDRPTGRLVYVWRVNAVLAGAGVELRLSERGEDEGRLVHTPLDPRSELPNVVLAAANSTTERARLEHAIVRFRSRHATRETKRDAVRALGDVLEHRRSEVRKLMTRKDDGALFQILNQFDIRHLNQAAREDYDELFLDWVFWTLLASLAYMDAKKAASVV